MRIALCSFGSEGDIRPVLALAQGLKRAGHEPYLVAAHMFAPRAQEAGIPLHSVGPRLSREEMQARLQATLTAMVNDRSPFRQTRLLFNSVAEDLRESLHHVFEATRETDVLLHSSLDIGAFVAAHVNHKPRISVQFFHGFLPARQALSNGTSLGPWLNPLLTRLALRLISRWTDGVFNRLFQAAGLPPRSNILLESSRSPLLNLLGVSPAVFPPDPLWEPLRVVQTGYWFMDVPPYQPSPELAAFMSGPDRPVVVSFGSMIGPDPRKMTELVCEATRRVGCRVVLQAGWNGLGEGQLPPHVLRVDYVPHDWLFPRAAAVVHHGGAGTTGAVLRAGVPHVVVWHLGDQLPWGQLMHRRGVAPCPPVHQSRLTVQWLERALRRALHEARLRDTAAALGERVRAENGVARALEAVEHVLR